MSRQNTAVGKTIRTNHDKENPYFMLARATAQDKQLSYEALGVLTYLLSQSDQWEVRVTELAQRGRGEKKQGLTRIYRILKELRTAGYVVLEAGYANGRIVNWTYHIHERPTDLLNQNLQVEKLDVENDSPNKDKEVPESTKKEKPFVANGATVESSHSSVKGNTKPQISKTKNPTPPSKVAPKVSPRQRDPIFDAVAEYIFGVTDPAIRLTMQPNETPEGKKQRRTTNTLVGIIKSWLKREIEYIPYGKTSKHVGFIGEGEIKPEHIKAFAVWYAQKHPTASMVTDGEKFTTYWRKWASAMKAKQQPRPAATAPQTPALSDEQKAARLAEIKRTRHGASA